MIRPEFEKMFVKVLALFLITILVVLNGCASRTDIMKTQTPVDVPRAAIVEPSRAAGSIWPGENAKNILFADNRARYVNDIVTIVVNESSEGTNKASTSTSRDTSTTAGIAALLGLDKTIQGSNENLKPKIEVGGSSSNSLKGKGDTTRGSRLVTRLTARVVRVLDNGNLVVEGRRQLTVNAEDQYIVVSGIIRPEDITSDNLIASQNIADAKIYYVGDGVVNDKLRPGWLTRVMDWVWPF